MMSMGGCRDARKRRCCPHVEVCNGQRRKKVSAHIAHGATIRSRIEFLRLRTGRIATRAIMNSCGRERHFEHPAFTAATDV